MKLLAALAWHALTTRASRARDCGCCPHHRPPARPDVRGAIPR